MGDTDATIAALIPLLKDAASKLNGDPDHLDRLLSQEQAADFLGYKPKTLEEWRYRGGGPKFVRVARRSIKYRRRDLLAWTEARLVSSTSAPLPHEAD